MPTLAARLSLNSATAYALMNNPDQAKRCLIEAHDGWAPRDAFERAGMDRATLRIEAGWSGRPTPANTSLVMEPMGSLRRPQLVQGRDREPPVGSVRVGSAGCVNGTVGALLATRTLGWKVNDDASAGR